MVSFSLFFYAWGEPVWVVLLLLSALVDYLNAHLIEKNRGKSLAVFGLVLSVIVNIGLLVVFKYSAFIIENINSLLSTSFYVPDFALPIGISFYSFQTLSYVIDVYRGDVKAQSSYMRFLMYVSLYHQLVAGPIVRYAHVEHEINNRKFHIRDISSGITRFCCGLFKKVFIANIAGEYVVRYMNGNIADLTIAESWFGALMFAIQIYFDFSAYSDMAIGLGKMFGFHYHENFRYPYISSSATEFWRRWHISLGTFFRDYLYIPLGGNKKYAYRNLLIVWFLTGLWHGASWNFIIWGLYFGFLIFIERIFLMKLVRKIPVFGNLYLLFAALIGWVIFYFEDMSRMVAYFKVMFGRTASPLWTFELGLVLRENIFWLAAALLFCTPVYFIVDKWIKRKVIASNTAAFFIVLTIVMNFVFLFFSTAMLVGRSYNPFIYFRF
ncbi:MAG: MBOAT family O-acyltransferase [Cytophagaceae bacterium]